MAWQCVCGNTNEDAITICDCGTTKFRAAEDLRKTKHKNPSNIEVEKQLEKFEDRESTVLVSNLVSKRHKTVRGLVAFSNFIGWICVISLLFLPFGLLILLTGH